MPTAPPIDIAMKEISIAKVFHDCGFACGSIQSAGRREVSSNSHLYDYLKVCSISLIFTNGSILANSKYMHTSVSVVPPLMERSYQSIPNRVLTAQRIMKAGGHPVAIAQVVEH